MTFKFNEDLLQYIWEKHLFDTKTLDIQCSDALSTPGLLHLYNIYCKNKSVCVVIGIKNSFLEAMNLIKYIERYAFGICTLLGEKFGIRASTIRLYFIYVSFFTFGSPVVLYLAIAFWLNIKHYMLARKQTLWDL